MDQESVHSWTVRAGQGSIRLDAFVRRCVPHLSMREIRRAIDAGEFCVDDRSARKGARLFGGQVITFNGSLHLLAAGPLPRSECKVQVLYEDDQILVVDKPAGMATHGFSGKATDTLANFLVAHRPAVARVGTSRWEPGLVHRLDRDTSGIVLIAKEQPAFENLRNQFRRRLVRKGYLALVWGKTDRTGVIAYPLAHDRRDRRKMTALMAETRGRSKARRWPAVTRFRTVGRSKELSLVAVEMETGVTHQIRAHLSAIGHPVAGDPLYGGDRPGSLGLGRQFLHACYLGCRHPGSGKQIELECPLPAELKEVLDRLGIRVPKSLGKTAC